MTPLSSRLLNTVGWLVASIGLVFIGKVVHGRSGEIRAIQLSGEVWACFFGLAVIYSLSLFLLATAWHCLLQFAGSQSTRPSRSINAFTTSQLAKYIPGNVFHLVGRHVILRGEGLPHTQLVLASTYEILGMLTAASLVTSAAIWLTSSDTQSSVMIAARGISISLLVAVLVAVYAANRLIASRLGWLLVAVVLHVSFFTIMGVIVASLATLLAPVPFALAAGAGVGAWIVGFLTPGVPAGIGTREVSMVILAGGELPQETLLVVAALFRGVTLVGDLLCFAIGHFVFNKK